jgi:hypothetical protein
LLNGFHKGRKINLVLIFSIRWSRNRLDASSMSADSGFFGSLTEIYHSG